ncbi:MAG: HEPN domain-containing protein [Deltaproteobacteria bacterium]|nr:HEPN domain-containing protein [Deltaproteobacteria bacterium]
MNDANESPLKTSRYTPSLNAEERRLLAQSEIEASETAWGAAEVLVTQRLHRDALSRAYFALFHAARGLLFAEGYDARGPDAVIEVLGLRLAATGEMPPEAPAVLARGQRYRELCDFGVGWVVSPERVLAELEVYEEHRTGLLAMLAARGVKGASGGA